MYLSKCQPVNANTFKNLGIGFIARFTGDLDDYLLYKDNGTAYGGIEKTHRTSI